MPRTTAPLLVAILGYGLIACTGNVAFDSPAGSGGGGVGAAGAPNGGSPGMECSVAGAGGATGTGAAPSDPPDCPPPSSQCADAICTALTLCNDAGTCDPATGLCSNPTKPEGATCLFGGACAAGACIDDPIAYIKASNTDKQDEFGMSIALSADGNTLAVGAPGEDSSALGVNSEDTGDNSGNGNGAVYVFTRAGAAWSQQAYIKASNTGHADLFGWSVALSADGDTLAVGARDEDSGATGVNGDQTDDSIEGSGAAYVFTRSGDAWAQEAYLKASNPGYNDRFGYQLALSADGDTLAVSAWTEDSGSPGVNGDQADNSRPDSGAVYMFTRSGGEWAQQAYIKSSIPRFYDYFGYSLALSADGDTLAVGAAGEDSGAKGINGAELAGAAFNAGAVYVLVRSAGAWSQQVYIKASNTGDSDGFGSSVALSGDGDTLAVGAPWEDGGAKGVNGDETDDSASDAGAVYVLVRTEGAWSQQSYIKASNSGKGDHFGRSVALSGDSQILVVGADSEDTNATGVNGEPKDDTIFFSGAAYAFVQSGGAWWQQAFLKATNTSYGNNFGWRVALSADATTLAVASYREDSSATGVNGNAADDSAPDAGAVYIY